MSVADTATYYDYNGYRYSIGDIITLKDRKLYYDSYGPSYMTVDGDYNWKICQIYPTQEVKIYIEYESGSQYYQGYSGFVYPSQIASGGLDIEHIVTFYANGGSGAPSAQTKYYGTVLTLSSTQPTRTGYTFQGWGISESDTSVDYAAGGQYGKDEDINLYAIWKKTITLSYNANGGSGAPSSQSANVYNATTSNKFTISSTKPTRTGYTFAGWSTSSTATSASYSSGGSITLSSSDTLYAVWTEHYLTVNYYSNNATYYNGTSTALNTVNNNNVLIWTQKYYYDNDYSSGLNNYSSGSTLGMIRTGYSPTGNWGTSTSGGTLVHQDTGFATGADLAHVLGKSLNSGNASVNVYAQWQANTYTISYKANSGTGTDQAQTVTYGVSWTTKGAIYTKTGYTQTSWNTKADGTGTNYSLNAGQTNQQLSNLTLYAQWKANTYTVTLDANGGSVSPTSKTVTYDSTYGTLPVPTRAGYKFLGWYTAKSGGTQITSSTKVTITANQTLYAQWEPMNVAYYNDNGTYVLCNTYGKVDGTWQPMLFYGKINGAWVRSVTDE